MKNIIPIKSKTDDEGVQYELTALRYKYDFFQLILIVSSTLLGVLIALLPEQFQPTEGRTLYVYCCIALALCSLISGTLLFLLREHPYHIAVMQNIEQYSRQEQNKIFLRIDCCSLSERFLSFCLFFLLLIVFSLLFYFLILALYPDNEFMKQLIPYLPEVVKKVFLVVIIIRTSFFLYKILRVSVEEFF
ncbi:hypothetical protein IX306_001948 [Porphyromonas levii]|nr:hypothetical protein [Porphyromonas levii]MBR8774808.1 hypothetical protein [Porphyromonas levii]MBR8801739.1 hypothetical protein [Porphyromonas levii]